MDRLQAMRLFTRIVELGSFSRAAQQLGLNRASATQIVKRLEAHLGARLLARTTRQVTTTVDGAAFGIIQVPRYHVTRQLASGEFDEILSQHRPPALPLNALYPPNRQPSAR